MRQTGFTRRKCKKRFNKKRKLPVLSSLVDSDSAMKLYIYKQAKNKEFSRIHTSQKTSNKKYKCQHKNVCSTQRSLSEFLFSANEIVKIR